MTDPKQGVVRPSHVALLLLIGAGALRAQTAPTPVAHPVFVPVRWNSTAANNAPFLFRFAVTSGWMNAEWGVSQATVKWGPDSGSYTISPSNPGTTITDSDIRNELFGQLQSGGLPSDLNDCDVVGTVTVCNKSYIYMVQMPPGFTTQSALNAQGTPGAYLCGATVDDTNVICGYHDTVPGMIVGSKNVHIRYAVTPDFGQATCMSHSILGGTLKCDHTGLVTDYTNGDTQCVPGKAGPNCRYLYQDGDPAANATIVLSHEAAEAAVDPDVPDGGLLPYELGDTCTPPRLFADAGFGVKGTVYGDLPGDGGTIQYLGHHDLSCTLQCADNPSACLAQEQSALVTVTKTGPGSGTITSSQGGISCGSGCSTQGPVLLPAATGLTASPAAGSTFAGWAGACTGTGTCTLTGTASNPTLQVTATFNKQGTVSIAKAGSGTGTVTSTPAGISCGTTCGSQQGVSFTAGTVVLTAAPAQGSAFIAWGGACSGAGTCTLTVSDNANVSVTASFNVIRTVTVNKSGAGAGTVTSSPAGISCGTGCTTQPGSFTSSSVTLTASPAAGSSFTGWSGDCSGTGTCQLTLTANHQVTANFFSSTLTVTKSGAGTGTVTSSDGHLNCGATCSATYASAALVTLSAVATPGLMFNGWTGGGCSGTGTCAVSMSTSQLVNADFEVPGIVLTKSGCGTGTITSVPAGLSCGSSCSASFASGTSVTLTATPDNNGSFVQAFSGGCSSTNQSCTMTVSQVTTVNVQFGYQCPSECGVQAVGPCADACPIVDCPAPPGGN